MLEAAGRGDVSEVDRGKGVWTVPASRMKTARTVCRVMFGAQAARAIAHARTHRDEQRRRPGSQGRGIGYDKVYYTYL